MHFVGKDAWRARHTLFVEQGAQVRVELLDGVISLRCVRCSASLSWQHVEDVAQDDS